ncbi:hypothetical protein Desaci_1306 [Desulfosporosinus acidiphilus SJ4]|uniref:Uncharacterized protein n=1 Tax=Desulfosporosinus acidiphilus (strain DSM 22704 / JCM 16185 / SJ4) TaxID=646529 RepID=I4D3F8_DESAJ|nr:hypothetical protein [Desulfosporosinus acidiphilus]AFM40332.1 hypothetical protein Desaci_1306 [Desulfosporosinus acidiphilus SJ4]
MVTLLAVKRAMNQVLAPIGLKIYGNEVKEGFSRPCFFVNLVPVKSEILKKDTRENSLMVEMVYFSESKTDLENLQMYDTLQGLLTPILVIGTRNLLVQNFRAEVIDELDHIYSVKFDLNFYDEIVDTTPEPDPMETLTIQLGGQ